MSDKDLHKAFQMMDPFGDFLVPISLIQSKIEVGEMYLWIMTYAHKLWVEMSLHPNFDAKVFAKKEVFLCPSLPMLLVLQFDPILPKEEPFDLFSQTIEKLSIFFWICSRLI